MRFSNLLIKWYLQNKRDLPWRNTSNPYAIWLSEIILQQTRVAQGTPYYFNFIHAFPTVFDLAKASEEQVLKLWQGLGYYSRARNLHQTAQNIAKNYNGNFPNNFADLLLLKGVGSYTAAAIASFAYNEAVPVVDGNVFRVLARYFDLDTDIALASSKKEFSILAHQLMPKKDPATFNQAIMEFGALQCVPKNPDCGRCIFNDSCAALQKNKVGLLPFKSKKTKVSVRYLHYIVPSDENQNTYLEKRTGKGIWQNLYQFPLIETEKSETLNTIVQQTDSLLPAINKIHTLEEWNKTPLIHKLSHQQLHIKFWIAHCYGTLVNGISIKKAIDFPFPIVLYHFLEAYQAQLQMEDKINN